MSAGVPSDTPTRPSLLVRLRDPRDAESWETFVRVYAPVVFAYCRRAGVQDADAADVTQEVLAQVARSIRGFDYRPERGRFRDWLRTVTRHKLARHFRKPAPTEAVDGLETVVAADPDPAWDEAFNARVLQAALEHARPAFEPATWRAFELTWLAGRPAQEVAAEVGLAIDAVYAAKSRVLKRLREEVLLLAEDLPQLFPAT
jgi:RNA polymerase sigma factor (sigma-70 family)